MGCFVTAFNAGGRGKDFFSCKCLLIACYAYNVFFFFSSFVCGQVLCCLFVLQSSVPQQASAFHTAPAPSSSCQAPQLPRPTTQTQSERPPPLSALTSRPAISPFPLPGGNSRHAALPWREGGGGSAPEHCAPARGRGCSSVTSSGVEEAPADWLRRPLTSPRSLPIGLSAAGQPIGDPDSGRAVSRQRQLGAGGVRRRPPCWRERRRGARAAAGGSGARGPPRGGLWRRAAGARRRRAAGARAAAAAAPAKDAAGGAAELGRSSDGGPEGCPVREGGEGGGGGGRRVPSPPRRPGGRRMLRAAPRPGRAAGEGPPRG